MMLKKIINLLINDLKEVKHFFAFSKYSSKYTYFFKLYNVKSTQFLTYLFRVELYFINFYDISYTKNTTILNNVKFKSILPYVINPIRFGRSMVFFKNLLSRVAIRFSSYFSILIFNLKWILIAFIVSVLYFFVSLFYIQIDFTKQISLWYIILISYYLLISTFNSFLVKYRYGKFTSAIQRFWKRTGMIFWLIEGFLFLLFFYYFVNSSQEPLYMFDFSNLNQEFLIQLKASYKNMILLSIAIYLSFILILNINFLIFYQTILLLLLISVIIFYTLYVESYQFVYIINIFSSKDWVFDDLKQSWVLEVEQNNLRVKQQYFTLCLIAKYWHFIFIFISWFFFLIKSLEANKISITLLGYNVQNLLILYVLNILCLVQWVKILFKKFFDITYYWFFIQYDEKMSVKTLIEIWETAISLISFNTNNYSTVFGNISTKIYYSNEIMLWKYVI